MATKYDELAAWLRERGWQPVPHGLGVDHGRFEAYAWTHERLRGRRLKFRHALEDELERELREAERARGAA